VDFQHSFHYETTHAANTYKELFQMPFNAHNSVLTNLLIQNKVSGSTNISIKIQYLSLADGTTTTDLEIIETKALATTATVNYITNDIHYIAKTTLGDGLHLPAGAKLFIKTSVDDSINVVATVKHYQNIEDIVSIKRLS
jgi:hypothetical protein